MLEIKSVNLYNRKNIVYIDANTTCGRMRFSSGLAWNLQNQAQVQKEASALIFAKLRGENILQSQSVALFDLCAEILSQSKSSGAKQSTLDTIASNFVRIKNHFGNKDLRLLGQKQVMDFLQQKCGHYTKNTLRTMCGILNRVISLANTRGANIEKIDMRKLKIGIEPKEIEPFSLDEITRILDSSSGEFRNLICVAFFSGMRTGELFGLKWKNVDFSANEIYIDSSVTKKGEDSSPKTNSSKRVIDMLPIVKQALEAQSRLTKGQKYIFGGDKPLRFDSVGIKWRALLKSLGLKHRTFYNTRHTFASLMFSKNEEPLWVSTMLGHKSLKITLDYYVRFIPNRKIKRASFLDDFTL